MSAIPGPAAMKARVTAARIVSRLGTSETALSANVGTSSTAMTAILQ